MNANLFFLVFASALPLVAGHAQYKKAHGGVALARTLTSNTAAPSAGLGIEAAMAMASSTGTTPSAAEKEAIAADPPSKYEIAVAKALGPRVPAASMKRPGQPGNDDGCGGHPGEDGAENTAAAAAATVASADDVTAHNPNRKFQRVALQARLMAKGGHDNKPCEAKETPTQKRLKSGDWHELQSAMMGSKILGGHHDPKLDLPGGTTTNGGSEAREAMLPLLHISKDATLRRR